MGEELATLGSKIQTSLDMWSAFLTRYNYLRELKVLPTSLDKPEIKKAIYCLNRMYFTDEEWEVYEGKLKWLRIQISTIKHYQEKGREKRLP